MKEKEKYCNYCCHIAYCMYVCLFIYFKFSNHTQKNNVIKNACKVCLTVGFELNTCIKTQLMFYFILFYYIVCMYMFYMLSNDEPTIHIHVHLRPSNLIV